jgi:hypothetical protein
LSAAEAKLQSITKLLQDGEFPAFGKLDYGYGKWPSIGQVGILAPHKIVQIVNKNEAIVEAGRDSWFLLKGVSTTGLVDGNSIESDKPIVFSGNYQYETVLGGTKTILKAETIDVANVAERMKARNAANSLLTRIRFCLGVFA